MRWVLSRDVGRMPVVGAADKKCAKEVAEVPSLGITVFIVDGGDDSMDCRRLLVRGRLWLLVMNWLQLH